jgi:hypothetical protein
VDITNTSVKCNGTELSNHFTSIIITGPNGALEDSSSPRIKFESVTADSVTLQDVTITSGIPFVCQSCSVTVFVKGHNVLNATDSVAGIGCSEWGNITLTSSPGASLLVQGGSSSPGIGSLPDASCHSVTISNSSITAIGGQGSSGIGTGSGTFLHLQFLKTIRILHSTVLAIGGEKSAGIGSDSVSWTFPSAVETFISHIQLFRRSVGRMLRGLRVDSVKALRRMFLRFAFPNRQ